MAATRSTVKRAEELRISQIGDVKKRLGGIVELPSGLVVHLVNPGGLKAFMTGNVIPNSLMAVIQKSLKSGTKPTAEELLSEQGDITPERMAEMMEIMDRVAMKTIREPKFHPNFTDADVEKWNNEHPEENDQVDEPEELESADKLYIHELPDDDKQFIFQWISGGTKDLEEFRKRQEQGMATVAASSSALSSSKSNSGTDAG